MDCDAMNRENPELGNSILAAGRMTSYLEAGAGGVGALRSARTEFGRV